jgi:hypothetical protein
MHCNDIVALVAAAAVVVSYAPPLDILPS